MFCFVDTIVRRYSRAYLKPCVMPPAGSWHHFITKAKNCARGLSVGRVQNPNSPNVQEAFCGIMARRAGGDMAISEEKPRLNTNKARKLSGQVVIEPSPSSAAESTSSDSQAYRADVELKLQKLPCQILGSDHYWNCLALSAAKYWELGPLAEDIKKFARNYGDRPATFGRKLKKLRMANWRKLASDPSQKEQVAWYIELQRRVDESSAAMLPPCSEDAGPERRDSLPTLLKNFNDKKLQAALLLLDVLEAPLAGRRPAETNLKNFIDACEILAASPTGRPPEILNREAFKLVRSRKYEDAASPYHCICEEIDPRYPGMSHNEKMKARRARREGVRRLQAAEAKKKRIKARNPRIIRAGI
jgi:hypothetical protein